MTFEKVRSKSMALLLDFIRWLVFFKNHVRDTYWIHALAKVMSHGLSDKKATDREAPSPLTPRNWWPNAVGNIHGMQIVWQTTRVEPGNNCTLEFMLAARMLWLLGRTWSNDTSLPGNMARPCTERDGRAITLPAWRRLARLRDQDQWLH